MTDYQLLTPEDIAGILAVKPRTVREKYAKRPGFPAPVYLPAGEGGCSRKRWRKSEIIGWLERINSAKSD